jgi:hypothetical protein
MYVERLRNFLKDLEPNKKDFYITQLHEIHKQQSDPKHNRSYIESKIFNLHSRKIITRSAHKPLKTKGLRPTFY